MKTKGPSGGERPSECKNVWLANLSSEGVEGMAGAADEEATVGVVTICEFLVHTTNWWLFCQIPSYYCIGRIWGCIN